MKLHLKFQHARIRVQRVGDGYPSVPNAPTDMLPAAATDPSARIINEGIFCATMVRAPAAAAAMISCIRDAPFPHLLVAMQDPPMFNGC